MPPLKSSPWHSWHDGASARAAVMCPAGSQPAGCCPVSTLKGAWELGLPQALIDTIPAKSNAAAVVSLVIGDILCTSHCSDGRGTGNTMLD